MHPKKEHLLPDTPFIFIIILPLQSSLLFQIATYYHAVDIHSSIPYLFILR
jgi:hypothetical protein